MINKSKKGFTLVEIMIVVVIIGLLAAMAIPAFNKVRESAREKAVLNNLRQIASAAQQYILDESVGSVTTSQLEGDYFQDIQEVSDENYTLTIFDDSTSISVQVDGEDVVYTF